MSNASFVNTAGRLLHHNLQVCATELHLSEAMQFSISLMLLWYLLMLAEDTHCRSYSVPAVGAHRHSLFPTTTLAIVCTELPPGPYPWLEA